MNEFNGTTFILLYVNALIIGEHMRAMWKVKSIVASKFEMKDMKGLHYLIGKALKSSIPHKDPFFTTSLHLGLIVQV